jgi:hypothetical protein
MCRRARVSLLRGMTGWRGRGRKRFLRGGSSDPTGVGRITGIGEKASAVPLIGTPAFALTADVKLDASRLAVWVAA